MDIAQVEGLIREHGIEVVKIGGSDMDGVFRGKRMLTEHFVEGCKSGHGFAQCDVIFGWDIAEQLIDGLAVGSASTGFADVLMQPDLDTFRVVPWEEGAAAVVCDYATEEGEPLAVSPRQVLRRVVERAQSMGYRPMMSAEFEVRLFRENQQSLRAKRFSDLEPLNPGLNCYSIHHASIDEHVVGRIRRMMIAYDVPVEGYNREHGEGMYEINLRYADALTAADNAMLYKSGAKEISAQQGVVPTFMAKYDDRIDGCSGHLHQSLWSRDGRNAFWDDGSARHASEVMRSYAAGVLSTLPEMMLLYAPNVNSYKRFVSGSWAPTTATWGFDNRTTALRAITGSANGCRLETRVPGADVNAYLGFAATLAGGLHGIERKLEPPAPVAGDAYRAIEAPGLPRSLTEAVDCFRGSAVAREYFGDEFVEHYARMRACEAEQFRRAVTDWERARYFEQV